MQLLKVRFLQSAAGIKCGFQKGGIYDLPLDKAKSFIKCNIAVPIVEIEKAIIKEKETRDVQVSNRTSRGTNKPSGSKTVSKGHGDKRRRANNKSNSVGNGTRRAASK